MNYQDAKLIKQADNDVNDTDNVALINTRARLMDEMGVTSNMGLTPDAVKSHPEFIAVKRAFDLSFARMRNVNSWFMKNFKKEYQQEMRNRYK